MGADVNPSSSLPQQPQDSGLRPESWKGRGHGQLALSHRGACRVQTQGSPCVSQFRGQGGPAAPPRVPSPQGRNFLSQKQPRKSMSAKSL